MIDKEKSAREFASRLGMLPLFEAQLKITPKSPVDAFKMAALEKLKLDKEKP
jgi:hypothetical protein